MDDRADVAAVDRLAAEGAHQLRAADGHLAAVHLRDHAAAALFAHVADARCLRLPPVGADQTAADGVARVDLGVRGVLDQLFILDRGVVHAADLEIALRQRAGLVQDDGADLRERLHEVRSLDEDAVRARAADPGEEAQRDGNDQRAGTGDHEEGQRAVKPHRPLRLTAQKQAGKRRQQEQRQRAEADRGGIDAREF